MFDQLFLRCLTLCLCLCAALAHAEPSVPAADNPTFATVGDRAITLNDVRAYLKSHPLLQASASSADGVSRIVDDMVNLRLLELESRRLEMQPEGNDEAAKERMAFAVRERSTQRCELPTEEEAKKFYDVHLNQFSSPLFVRTSRVLLPEGAQAGGQAAKDYLIAQAKLVSNGQKTFEQLVGEVRPMLDKESRIGDMGFQRMEENDSLIRALASAKVGELVGPVERNNFVFLFQITDRREPVVTPWEKAKVTAQQVAQQDCSRVRFRLLRLELEKRFPVVIDREALAKFQL